MTNLRVVNVPQFLGSCFFQATKRLQDIITKEYSMGYEVKQARIFQSDWIWTPLTLPRFPMSHRVSHLTGKCLVSPKILRLRAQVYSCPDHRRQDKGYNINVFLES